MEYMVHGLSPVYVIQNIIITLTEIMYSAAFDLSSLFDSLPFHCSVHVCVRGGAKNQLMQKVYSTYRYSLLSQLDCKYTLMSRFVLE